MKHFINVLVILILTGFAVGIAILQFNDMQHPWGVAFLPIGVMMFAWGYKISNDY